MSEQHVHRFAQAVIPLFENCEFCGEKIVCTNESSRSYHVAVFNPAYQCSQCLKFCHKQCCDTADSICPCSGVPETSRNQELLFTAFPVNHSLAENTVRFYEDYMKPTFMKKDDKSTQFQSTRSIRNHSNRDDDSDSDDEDIKEIHHLELLKSGSKKNHLLEDSSHITNEYTIPPRIASDGDDLISKEGFLTVIIQQATNVSLPMVVVVCPV